MRSSPISKAKRGREVYKLSIRAQRQKPLNEAHQPTLAPRAAKTRHRPGTSERSLPAVPILVTGRSANRRLGVPNPRHPRPLFSPWPAPAQASSRHARTHLDAPGPRCPICYSRPMSMPPAVSPFVPGRGGLPPYLAGRDNEQHALKRLLAYLEHGRGAPRDVIVVGPCGNGKTVLLRWFQREIEAGETKIDAVRLTPSDIRSLDGLATELVPPRRFASLRPESLSFSVGIGRLGWELGDRPASLTRLLAARCRQRALVVLLDEAHDLDKDVANVLLNASQSVAADAPILLVLAGTPGLQAHLNTISATFWNRAGQIGVGRLDTEAASAALIRPLAAQSPAIAFEDAASGGAGQRRLCLALTGSRQRLGARHPQSDELHRSHGTARWSSPVIGVHAVEAELSHPGPAQPARPSAERPDGLLPAVRQARKARVTFAMTPEPRPIEKARRSPRLTPSRTPRAPSRARWRRCRPGSRSTP